MSVIESVAADWAPGESLSSLDPNNCSLNSARFVRYFTHPNGPPKPGNEKVEALGDIGRPIHSVLVSKDSFGRSFEYASHGIYLGMICLTKDKAYEQVISDEAERLDGLVAKALNDGNELYVSMSLLGQEDVSRFARLEGFVTDYDEQGILRPQPVISDMDGNFGLPPLALNGLYLLKD